MAPARAAARSSGSITLEILIAFAVASLVLTSVILLVGGSDALALERESAERSIAMRALDDVRMASSSDFFSLRSFATSTTEDRISYSLMLAASDITPCVKAIAATATSTGGVGDGVSLAARLADAAVALAQGGDCEADAPADAWEHIVQTGSGTLSGVSGTAVDALGGYEYVGLSAAPYFAVFDSAGSAVTLANGFALPEAPSALDAAYVHGEPYVFAAMASSTDQFIVVDVRDPARPAIAVERSLAGVKPDGADPAAYHVLYDGDRAYVTTRYISGPQPELHIFDVDDPAHASELGTASLETTVNGMAVRKRIIDGTMRTYLYAALAHDAKELAVYDVTHAEAVSATPVFTYDLLGNQDGKSISIQGSTLFLGRASNTAGPELYAFNISDAHAAPALLGSVEITSKDITAVIPVGRIAFIAATADGVSNRMIEAWDIRDPAHMRLLAAVKDPGLAPGGIDYAGNTLFAVGVSTFLMYGGH